MLHRAQVLVVILLLLAVVSTVSLAIVSRSVTDLSVSTTQEESSRALAAAEAGIESALSSVVASGSTQVLDNSNNAQYTVTILPASSGTDLISSRGLTANETETFFLGEHDGTGNMVLNGSTEYRGNSITVCWGDQAVAGQSNAPALEVSLYYWNKNTSKYEVVRNGYDPNTRGAFGAIDAGVVGCPAGHAFSFKKTITLTATVASGGLALPGSVDQLMLRTRVFYSGEVGHFVGLKAVAGSTFPQQGIIISSTGQAGSSTRKVQLLQKYSNPLPQFDNAVFSGASLSQ